MGIFIKNRTRRTIAYTAPDGQFSISIRGKGDFGDTQYIPDDYVDDSGIRRIIIKKVVEVVSGDQAESDERAQFEVTAAAREERRATVLDVMDEAEDELVRVQCHATTASGGQCQRKVTVSAKVVAEGDPVYCRQHEPVAEDE